MVVSCYRPDYDVEQFRNDLRELRGGVDIIYAFMDYDQSIQLPPDVSVKDCRRPSKEAWMGLDLYKPLDVWLGESQYNPFAFDVAMLGNLFSSYLSVRIRPFRPRGIKLTHASVYAYRGRFRWSRRCLRCSTG